MQTKEFDVVVIGTGPGGEGASMKAVKSGKKVGVVEKYSLVGGGCTHWGTIPSKSLRQVAGQLLDIKSNPLLEKLSINFDYPQLVKSAESVISKQVKMRQTFYDRNDTELFSGFAFFKDKNTVEVYNENGVVTANLKSNAFVIASGSRPYRPNDIDFQHKRVFDSDTILSLKENPHSITIYGAGVIGCEYASIFRSIGCKVNLINTRDKLLSFLDDEIIDALSYHLREQGILIRHNEVYEKLEALDDSVTLHMKSGKQIKSDILLFANGRTGNSQKMGMAEIGIQLNSREQIEVNENYQTSLSHIYAVGDIIGYPSLASAAYDQGRFASTHIVDGKCDAKLVRNIPTGIYTSPEISSLGKTEKELTEEKIPYEVGHASFKSLARAQITGKTTGMLKLLFHRETLQVLGIHCFGAEASEIIHIGQAIFSQKDEANTLLYFINTTFNYPTMAEAYRVAALNGINRVQ
jgi:NAD(P) transhydrogenase